MDSNSHAAAVSTRCLILNHPAQQNAYLGFENRVFRHVCQFATEDAPAFDRWHARKLIRRNESPHSQLLALDIMASLARCIAGNRSSNETVRYLEDLWLSSGKTADRRFWATASRFIAMQAIMPPIAATDWFKRALNLYKESTGQLHPLRKSVGELLLDRLAASGEDTTHRTLQNWLKLYENPPKQAASQQRLLSPIAKQAAERSLLL